MLLHEDFTLLPCSFLVLLSLLRERPFSPIRIMRQTHLLGHLMNDSVFVRLQAGWKVVLRRG